MGLATLSAAPASAAEYTTILLEKTVNRTPDQTWAKIGPYCAIATWLKVTCVITAGNGVSVGTNRLLNGNNNEIMVAATPYSYTYTQPASTILYHGTLAVEPMDRGRTDRIVYTLFYDQAPLGTPEAKAANRASRTKRFNEALDAMKRWRKRRNRSPPASKVWKKESAMIDILQLVPLAARSPEGAGSALSHP